MHERVCHVVELPLDRTDSFLAFGGDCGHYASAYEQREERHNDRGSGKAGQLLVVPFCAKVHRNDSGNLAL